MKSSKAVFKFGRQFSPIVYTFFDNYVKKKTISKLFVCKLFSFTIVTLKRKKIVSNRCIDGL